MAKLNFNVSDYDPQQPFDVLPAGKYVVELEASEMRPTAKGDGEYLWLQFRIVEGEHEGRNVWDRLNLVNPNPKAVQIARGQLSALCRACGREDVVDDSEELHFIPVVATIRVRPAGVDQRTGREYDASNEIRGYAPVIKSERVVPLERETARHPQAAAPQQKAAWKR